MELEVSLIKDTFDSVFYKIQLESLGLDLSDKSEIDHFLELGWKLGLNPNIDFDCAKYLSKYSDVRLSNMNPYVHYILFGISEKRVKFASVTKNTTHGLLQEVVLRNYQELSEELSLIIGSKACEVLVSNKEEFIVSTASFLYFFNVLEFPENISVDGDVISKERIFFIGEYKFEYTTFKVSKVKRVEKLPSLYSGFSTKKEQIYIDGPKLLFITNANDDKDPSRFYRCVNKLDLYSMYGIKTDIISDSDLIRNVKNGEHELLKVLTSYSKIIFQRSPFTSTFFKVFNFCNLLGVDVVYETDDLNFKPWLANESASVLSGRVSKDDAGYIKSLENRMKAMLHCSKVITSTPMLKRELASLGVSSYVLPNTVESELYRIGSIRKNLTIKDGKINLIYMSGSVTHYGDARIILPDLVNILEKYHQKVSLTILGDVCLSDWEEVLEYENVNYKSKVTRKEMMAILASQDISLVPLEKTRFNICKSSLKFIEGSALGVVTIASPLYEFKRDIARSGGKIAWDNDFFDPIEFYIKNPEALMKDKVLAHEYSSKIYSSTTRNSEFMDWLF
ncbi:TPA: hypothetical protein NJ488_001558 [Vibrio parahaemolyticus]|uniref:hypothetical protein n=1 Tax=Vibrio parahaemolyticus TaxID=670 RepID=UPI00226A5D01|nr:hypothetical protein [Vibrio parahaemolyticus]MCX8925355.1 hypothetical protein [Vibrio parahaemolyticus]HCG8183294.1 hypothetical protein [Vibrio parahaemolyticus]